MQAPREAPGMGAPPGEKKGKDTVGRAPPPGRALCALAPLPDAHASPCAGHPVSRPHDVEHPCWCWLS